MLSADLIARLGHGHLHAPLPDAGGVSFHSDRTRPGDAFFALPGASGHGITHADDALAHGAAFVVSDRPHPRGLQVEDPLHTLLALGRHARQQLHGPVVGVTGSAGKTSTKALAATALGAAASPGSFNIPTMAAQTLVDAWLAGRTSPTEVLVLELGIDYLGEMDLHLSVAAPTHGILTLIGAGHLSGLGDIERVAQEKSRLLAGCRYALVSAQAAPLARTALQQQGLALPAHTVVYGLAGDTGATATGHIVDCTADGQTIAYQNTTFHLPYPGAAMARNAVAAMALTQLLNQDLPAAAKRLESAKLEGSRLQVRHLGPLTLIDDSYNSNPASAAEALRVLRACPAPRTAILGDMRELGDRSEALHRELGRATLGLDQVWTVGAEARFIAAENPAAHHYDTVETLLAALTSTALHGSVLVKGSRALKLERIVRALQSEAAA